MRTLPLGDASPGSTLRSLAFLPGDPTVRLSAHGFDRATVTPDGPGRISVSWQDGTATIHGEGDGARWLAERAHRLLGLDDDVRGFAPDSPPRLRDAWRRRRGDRVPRTGTLWHDLAWTIVQQRVNGLDAAAQWQRWIRAAGTPLGEGLIAPPSARDAAGTGYEEFHRFGIERGRAQALRSAARMADRLGDLVDGDGEPILRALGAEPGLGPWTLSWIRAQTFGDRDAVIVGDYGIPSAIAWLLAGEERADDARMLDLLEAYRPHRHRIIRLTFGAGGPPRRAPRGRRTDIRGY